MPFFHLTFHKEIDVSVEAESKEALIEAATRALKREIDMYWDQPDWEFKICEVSPALARNIKKATMGLHKGELLAWEDYVKHR